VGHFGYRKYLKVSPDPPVGEFVLTPSETNVLAAQRLMIGAATLLALGMAAAIVTEQRAKD
jgi:hypothetical protein